VGFVIREISTHYKMIVFDAGGTLISADWPRVTQDLAAAAAEHGLELEPDDVRRSFQHTWQEVLQGKIQDQADSREAVTHFWNQLLARTLARAAGEPVNPLLSCNSSIANPLPSCNPFALTARTFYPTFDTGDYHRLIDGADATLRALAAAGYRLGLLSNWSPNLPNVLDRLNIRHHFEFIIVSSLVGLAKPDPAIFDLAVDKSGCRPEELLYVGDSPAADVAGSRAAGWDSALIARRDHSSEIKATFKINNLMELTTLLGVK